jgi:glycosyltransferase involved in cell wall biosynthesis
VVQHARLDSLASERCAATQTPDERPVAPVVGDLWSPRVSIVMPVHNGMPYLPLALDSILAQTFRDFELIAIDDGSADATADILARYAVAHGRIRVLTNPANRGIVAALNIGLDAARGELIARMDADDIALPDRLRRQIAFLDAHPDHVLVGCSSSFIDASGAVTFGDVYWRQVEHWELEWIVHFFTAMLHPTATFRASPVQQQALRYDEHCRDAEDMDFFLRLLQSGKGAILREPLLQVRRVKSGVTARFFAEQKRTARDIALRYLLARYPELAPRLDAVKPVVDMLQRQGLPAEQPLPQVFDAMVLLEQRFLLGRRLTPRQTRRIHCLTAFWLLWGIFQAGRLRPSREMLVMLWRGRAYWRMFCLEAVSISLEHGAFAVRRRARAVLLRFRPAAGSPCGSH